MKDTTKILEEFYEKFPPVECSAHERTSSSFCICEDLPDINAENVAIKSFLTTSIQQAIAEERARVRGNLPEIRVSALSLLINDCANCGQVINRSFVDDLTCRIQDEYKQKILDSLDEPLKERTKL